MLCALNAPKGILVFELQDCDSMPDYDSVSVLAKVTRDFGAGCVRLSLIWESLTGRALDMSRAKAFNGFEGFGVGSVGNSRVGLSTNRGDASLGDTHE